MGKIFISYSRRDIEMADRLDSDLKRHHFQIWMDRNNIVGGELWRQSIIQGIEQTTLVLVLISNNSLASASVLDEIKISLANRKIIIPLIIEEFENFLTILNELALDEYQVIDFAHLGYEKAFLQLKMALDYWTFPEKLRQDLAHFNTRIRLRALEDLGKNREAFSNAFTLDALVDALRGEAERHIATQMIIFIGRFQSPWAIEILLISFSNLKESLRFSKPPPRHDIMVLAAILSELAVIGMGDIRVKNLLIEHLNHDSPILQSLASEALVSFQNGVSTLALSTFIDLLKDSDPNVRAYAARTLGMLGDIRAIEYLTPLLSNQLSFVQQAAEVSLDMLGYGK